MTLEDESNVDEISVESAGTSRGLLPLSARRWMDEMEAVLLPKLRTALDRAERGHCARVVDLDTTVSSRLARRLRELCPAEVHVLVGDRDDDAVDQDVAITSTRLVELRNRITGPSAESTTPHVLLVFIPPGTHASAEDSFGGSTFAEIDTDNPIGSIVERRMSDLPEQLHDSITTMVDLLREECGLDHRPDALARYLLTCALNDNDADAAGAALFELGLVPDFELFRDPASVRRRVRHNIDAIRILSEASTTERQRVLRLELPNTDLRTRLAALMTGEGTLSNRWLRRIAEDSSCWTLNFSKWQFGEAGPREIITVEVIELSLPRAGDRPEDTRQHEVLQRLTGQHYLLGGQRGNSQLSVKFRCDPPPYHVPGLARLMVQIRPLEGGPVLVSKPVKAAKTSSAKTTLYKLNHVGWDEGWHVVRVTPVDVDNIPLDVAASGIDKPLHESEPFYVIPEGELDEPVSRAMRTEAGVTQALRRHQVDAARAGEDPAEVRVTDVRMELTSSDGRHMAVVAQFGRRSPARISVPAAFVDAERRILAEPRRLAMFRIDLDAGSNLLELAEALPLTVDQAVAESFYTARTEIFEQISAGPGLVEGGELSALQPYVTSYAIAYLDLIRAAVDQVSRAHPDQQRDARRQLAGLLAVDGVQLPITDKRGDRWEVVLLAPTHPMRLLWLSGWDRFAQSWISRIPGGVKQAATAAQHGLLSVLNPLGFPFMVPSHDLSMLMAAEALGPYWTAYVPADVVDRVALFDSLREQLGDGRSSADQEEVVFQLTRHIDRYLRLHPYVRDLTVNIVNPSTDATTLALVESVNQLVSGSSRAPDATAIAWDIRLFVCNPEDPASEAVARELAEILNDNRRQHHSPVALVPLSYFRDHPETYTAHLTIIFDAFGRRAYDCETATGPTGNAPVHGLVLDIESQFVMDGTRLIWKSAPTAGAALPIGSADEQAWLRTELPSVLNHATCVACTGDTAKQLVPIANVVVDGTDRARLHDAQRSSDWVITVDRLVDVQFFDQPSRLGRRDYVIDFSPESATGLDHRIVVTARAVDELVALLAPALRYHDIDIPETSIPVVFDQLRLLSERLALRLAGTPLTERTEVLGLALARLYLGYRGVLSDHIVIPLDSHLDLFQGSDGAGTGLRRTDLALVAVDFETRTLTFQLVEVKCYTSLTGIGAVNRLLEGIGQQLDQSADSLARYFDPNACALDYPDRALRTSMLRMLLGGYLDRAERHATVSAPAARRIRGFLRELDDGYRLAFERTAVVFHLHRDNGEVEWRDGIEVHHLGRGDVAKLIAAIPAGRSEETQLDVTVGAMSETELTVPRSEGTAFTRLASTASRVSASRDGSREENPVQEPAPVAYTGAGPRTKPSNEQPGVSSSVATSSKVGGPDILLGTQGETPQYGMLGRTAGRSVAVDLNETHTISLFGVQGSGKSYTLGSLIEMASLPAPPVNRLVSPLATIVFHYSPTQDYAPEFTSMTAPNDATAEVKTLWEQYGAKPVGMSAVVLLVPEDKVAVRIEEHPGISVRPLKFGSAELQAAHWKMLMGAVGNQSTYIRQLTQIMRRRRETLTLDAITDGVNSSVLPDHLKHLAHQRLDLAATYIDDSARLADVVQPGQLIIVDLRDEFIEKDEALSLFVVLMQLFAEAQVDGHSFNKLVVFDEAHKYIDSVDLVTELVETVREMRHKGMSVLVASQDPPSVPVSLIELSDQIILHKFTSPAWLRHLQRANSALSGLTAEKLAALGPGEAFVWSGKASDRAFVDGAMRIRLRPRLTRHGGATRTAIR